MHVQIVDSSTAAAALAPAWQTLAAADPSATEFQLPAFGLGWLATAAGPTSARPALICAWDGDRLVGLLPGCTARRAGLRMFTWLGGFDAVDYGGMLVDPAYGDGSPGSRRAVARVLLAHAGRRAGGQMLYLQNVRHDNPDFGLYSHVLSPYLHDTAPYLLPEDLSEPRVHKALTKGNWPRLERKMRREGEVWMGRVTPDDPRLARLASDFVRIKRERLAVQGGLGPFADDRQAQFYVEQISSNPDCDFSVLEFDGQLAAAHLGYRTATRFYYLLPAFDDRFRHYSPSMVLMRQLVDETLTGGLIFDFCIGAEAYKNKWTDREVAVTGFVSRNLAGRAFLRAKWTQRWLAERRAAEDES